MKTDRAGVCDLLAEYGALIDLAKFDEWLGLFAEECRYQIVPRENFDRGLPAALVFCDSRAMLEDRIRALREANKYNIHNDRHVIGLPRVFDGGPDGLRVEAPFVLVDGAHGLRGRLAPLGIVVRDCTSFGLPDCVRVAVPDAAGLERLDAALRAVAVEEMSA